MNKSYLISILVTSLIAYGCVTKTPVSTLKYKELDSAACLNIEREDIIVTTWKEFNDGNQPKQYNKFFTFADNVTGTLLLNTPFAYVVKIKDIECGGITDELGNTAVFFTDSPVSIELKNAVQLAPSVE